jgi:hypothetical protein
MSSLSIDQTQQRLERMRETLLTDIALMEEHDEDGQSDGVFWARQNLEALDTALRLLRAQQWQDISTAPQMRKVIVFYLNALGKRRTVMACYYKAKSLEMDDDYTDVGEYDDTTGCSYAPEGWYEEHDASDPLMPLQESPLFWMPLPVSPLVGCAPVSALEPASGLQSEAQKSNSSNSVIGSPQQKKE